MRYEVAVLADDGDANDPGQLELGTVIVTKDTEQEAVEAAHDITGSAVPSMTSSRSWPVG